MQGWITLSLLILLDHKRTICQDYRNQKKQELKLFYHQSKPITEIRILQDQKAPDKLEERILLVMWIQLVLFRNQDMLKLLKAKCLTSLTNKLSIHSRAVIKEILSVRVQEIVLELLTVLTLTVATVLEKVQTEESQALLEQTIWNNFLNKIILDKEQWVGTIAINSLKVIKSKAELDLIMKLSHQMLDILMKASLLTVSKTNKNNFYENLLVFKDNNRKETKLTFHSHNNKKWLLSINNKDRVYCMIKLTRRSTAILFRLIDQDAHQ